MNPREIGRLTMYHARFNTKTTFGVKRLRLRVGMEGQS